MRIVSPSFIRFTVILPAVHENSVPVFYTVYSYLGGGGQWRKMAKNGEKWRKMAMANSAFSFVKFANFSPIFDFRISHLTDFHTANHLETLQSHYWHRYRTDATHIE